MHKNVFGRQFKRDTNERKALFKNLLTSLVLQERIRTTQAKAKAIQPAADKLVTKAKKNGSDAYRTLQPDINYNAVKKLIEEIAPRFATRSGGYTRIVKLQKRRIADNAPMVVMEWVEKKHQDEGGGNGSKLLTRATPMQTVVKTTAKRKRPESSRTDKKTKEIGRTKAQVTGGVLKKRQMKAAGKSGKK